MNDNDDDLYLIWSNEHRAWWRASARGYTAGIMAAGRYTRRQALDICRQAIPQAMHVGAAAEIPVRERDLLDFTRDQMLPAAFVRGRE